METKSRELIVGFFLIFGLVLMAGLILVFGKLQDEFSDTYLLKVTFPNASGLLKGSNVNFSGATIGRVTSHPKFIDEGRAVEVELRIRSDARIREDARFTIGSSGLLGDRFVDVEPKSYTAKLLQNGQTVKGERVPGLADMMAKVEPLIDNATSIALEAQKTLKKFNQDVLTPTTMDDLRGAISRANNVMAKAEQAVTSADKALQELKTKIEPLVGNMNTFVTDAKGAIGEIKKTLDRVNNDVLTPEVAADFRSAVTRAKELLIKTERAVDSTNVAVLKVGGLVETVRTGKGGIARLLNDPEVADNLAVFISQLRKRGVLWYSDQKLKKPLENPTPEAPAGTGSKERSDDASPNSRKTGATSGTKQKSSSTGNRRTTTTR
ncbi:MAG: MlaD family protein [Candidatus Methylacidiphilales bacterium]|nr:MlaD family protein [Candidatus Methylacidiphilales bacterium]